MCVCEADCVVPPWSGYSAIPIRPAQVPGNTAVPPSLSEWSRWAETNTGGGALLRLHRRPGESCTSAMSHHVSHQVFCWSLPTVFFPCAVHPFCHCCHWDPVQQGADLLFTSLCSCSFQWSKVRVTHHPPLATDRGNCLILVLLDLGLPLIHSAIVSCITGLTSLHDLEIWVRLKGSSGYYVQKPPAELFLSLWLILFSLWCPPRICSWPTSIFHLVHAASGPSYPQSWCVLPFLCWWHSLHALKTVLKNFLELNDDWGHSVQNP